jgi:hypothetical protein
MAHIVTFSMPQEMLKEAVTAMTICPEEEYVQRHMTAKYPDRWICVGGYNFTYNVSRCNQTIAVLKVKKGERWYKMLIYSPPNIEVSPVLRSVAVSED